MSVQKVLGPRRPPLGFYTKPGLLDERPRRAERELRARAEVDDEELACSGSIAIDLQYMLLTNYQKILLGTINK